MQNQSKQQGGFANGFLLGILIGAIIVFLIATKKGKRILKTLTENGFEGIEELSDLFADDEEEYESKDEEDGNKKTESVKTPAKPMKRFFRGIKR